MKSRKITEIAPRPRWYDDACATAHALDLLGERWALLVVRELMFGPKRFGDLRAGLPGISANVLTQRLEGLEAAGVLLRRRLPPPASAQVYELTEWGREAEPIFQALGRWAARSPSHDPTLPFSAASLLLSLRTMLDARRARGLALRFGLRLGGEVFTGELADGHLTLARGAPVTAAFILEGPPPLVAAAIYGGQGLGILTVEGDRAMAERFLTLFPLPEKAPRG
jgi:DNA-binding HxlR family transcriptional regulator